MTTFDDLDAYVATRRAAGLAISPDGSRLVTTVSELAPDRTSYVTSLWEVDPAGHVPARRLTRSDKGESAPWFTPAGDLLFLSGRADPGAPPGDTKGEGAALWLLPAAGGEARPVLERAGGVRSFAVARGSGHVAVATQAPPAEGEHADRGSAQDRARAQEDAREAAGVAARLHTGYPVRFWDHDLGPGYPHLARTEPIVPDAERAGDPVDIAPGPGERLGGYATAPDGATIALVVQVADEADPAARRNRIELVDVVTAARTVVADEPGADHEHPQFSRDGRTLFWIRERHPRPGRGVRHTIRGRDLRSGDEADVAGDREWTVRELVAGVRDELYVVADERGHAPVYRVTDTGVVTRLTRSGAYGDLVVGDDALYALRSAIDTPPTPVRLDPHTVDQEPGGGGTGPLRGVTEIDELPGTLTEVHATADDGTALRAWLVLPSGADAAAPAALLLWVHGGPLSSWNAWMWRWNPWLMAARGYAVLLPDPRLSTGYGQAFVDAATGAWSGLPYTDLMTITDEALRRDDLDASRTAAMGGSFGGYMANWIAGHTDRFAAIVTHAGIWHLDGFVGSTDASFHWAREWGDPLSACSPSPASERYAEHSPHRHVRAITTPMLVIHGDKDYRVPISEGLRLWYDLQRCGVESQFLYYPDENHWILRPGDAKLWYSAVLAFLDHHVLGEDWQRPGLV